MDINGKRGAFLFEVAVYLVSLHIVVFSLYVALVREGNKKLEEADSKRNHYDGEVLWLE